MPNVGDRVHIVLVPGFAGFDALGKVEYYAGTTRAFQDWQKQRETGEEGVVLHYFPNLPTAGVATRAQRLRSYLAKRIARGEIQRRDSVALVGHSTGGLDIRRLLYSRHQEDTLQLDGGAALDASSPHQTAVEFEHAEILGRVSNVVFVSVPQYGTNIADWVRANGALRRLALRGFLSAVEGARFRQLQRAESIMLDTVAGLVRESDLVLAARDALDETQVATEDPAVRAAALEAGSALRLWLSLANEDFAAIDDLASCPRPPQASTSPAHYSEGDRRTELQVWRDNEISTMSVATIAKRAYHFDTATPAPPFELSDPRTWPNRKLVDGSDQMDVSYLLAYRACAGGPFQAAPPTVKTCADIGSVDTTLFDPSRLGPDGPRPGMPLQTWDNDGIVNTASMLWPNQEKTLLAAADHLDITGHYALRRTIPSPNSTGRRFASYDALRSTTGFNAAAFQRVWSAIFDFCVS